MSALLSPPEGAPLPRVLLAVLLAWLMPWAAVRCLRRADRAILYMVDAVVTQDRVTRESAACPEPPAARYEGRHLKGAPRRT